MTDTLDLMGPDEMADPGLSASRLLAGDRCRFYDGFEPPFYILSRYDDIADALLDPSTFVSGQGQGPNFVPPIGVVSDPPYHTFFRRLVQDDFKPAAIAKLKIRLEEIADELLDAVDDQEVWDLHDHLSFPLPVTIICEIFGIPTDDIWQFKHWSDASVAALSAQDPTAYDAELARMRAYILELLHQKKADLGDDSLLARISRARRDDIDITDEEALGLVLQLFVAGNETTTSLITNFMWRFLEHGLWPDFCAGKIDIDKAINESLRFDPPLLGLFRTTAEDVTLAGTRVPEGTKILTHYAAANRDPAMWENPNTFDVTRPIKKVMSFGLGIHFCLGAELAKLETKVTLAALARRAPDLKLVNDGERIGPFLFWGRKKLPVRWG
ncbi:MAG: cytochrome P450 [Alphaproteobacteria bacterium]